MGSVRGTGQFNIDVSLTKRIPFQLFGDRSAFVFRADAFNALNHPIFDEPVLEYTNSSFGTVTDTISNPRVFQFALRVEF